MKVFSFLGNGEFYIILLSILYWCVDSGLGVRVAVMLMLSGSLNDTLKMALQGPRPYWYSSQVKGLATEKSFGVPSGHAQNAAAIWGTMAAYLGKWWAWLFAIVIIFFIGLSRLYLGVHFFHDVFLGWLVGGLLLWLTLHFWDRAAIWAKKQSSGCQILTAFLVSLILFLLPFIPFACLKAANWQAPQTWASYATQAVSLEGAVFSSGTFFGLMAGFSWINRLGGFQTKGVWWKLVLRFCLGITVVLFLYNLRTILPEGETALVYFLHYLHYALIGFWLTGGASWVFIRLKIADKK